MSARQTPLSYGLPQAVGPGIRTRERGATSLAKATAAAELPGWSGSTNAAAIAMLIYRAVLLAASTQSSLGRAAL